MTPPPIHTVTAEADPDDGHPSWSSLRFGCSGGPEDECHQWCAEGCEEECIGDGVHRWTAEAYGSGGCRIVDWIDAFGAEDAYAGDDEPLRVGTHRIEDEWTGDNYVWRYEEQAMAVDDAGVPR